MASCEGRTTIDFYMVDRDGTNRRALTNLGVDVPVVPVLDACNLRYSLAGQRWYYEVGCLRLIDTREEYVYSIDLNGDNVLVLDAESYLRTTDGSDLVLEYIDVRSIDPRPEGVYITLQTDFGADLNINPDAVEYNLIQWRVLRVTEPGSVQTIYEQLTPNFDIGDHIELDSGVLSPSGQHIVMHYNDGAVAMVNLLTGQNSMEIPGNNAICDVVWFENHSIIYNVGGVTCNDLRTSRPQGVWSLDIESGIGTDLTADLDGPAWLLATTN